MVKPYKTDQTNDKHQGESSVRNTKQQAALFKSEAQT